MTLTDIVTLFLANSVCVYIYYFVISYMIYAVFIALLPTAEILDMLVSDSLSTRNSTFLYLYPQGTSTHHRGCSRE